MRHWSQVWIKRSFPGAGLSANTANTKDRVMAKATKSLWENK